MMELAFDFNLLKLIFFSMAASVFVVGNLINFLEERLPTVIVQSFRYGKFSYVGSTTFKLIEVPKSWFKHFYVFASLYSFYGLFLVVDVYLYNGKLPEHVIAMLNLAGGSSRITTVEPLAALIAMTLVSLQCVRRFYETWFVSVFSRGKMNLSHYMVGYMHYWGTVTVILAEARGFSSQATGNLSVHLSQMTLLQWLGVALFIYAWYYQFQSAIILANLRKNPSGQVVSAAHKIPHGGLFEILSSPHLSCEAVIYLSLALVLKSSSTFSYVFFWVLVNQMETALLNHWWYKKTFKNYPKQRKAFIPFLL